MRNYRTFTERALLLVVIVVLVYAYSTQRTDAVAQSNSSANESKALDSEELRLFRVAFNESKTEQLLEHVSKNNNIPREHLRISTASMFIYRYLGQKTTPYSTSMIESPFWVVKVQDNESNRAYEVYVQDGTSIYKSRIMTDEQSQELALHFKKYGKMESDLYNALASMKGEDKINVIIWPVVVYPPGFNPDDYIPETTVEYFIKTKGPYDLVILEPLVYSIDLPEDIIRELGQRKDVENITIGRKVGNNTRVVMRIKPTIVDEEIKPLEEFILNKTSDITFMKPVLFARGLTKNMVLELNNRSDVINIAMEHTFRSEAAQEESVKKEEKTPVAVESEQMITETAVPTPTAQASPEAPGFEMVFGIIGILAVWRRLKK